MCIFVDDDIAITGPMVHLCSFRAFLLLCRLSSFVQLLFPTDHELAFHLCASLIFVLLHPQVTISINHRYQPWPPPTMSQSGSTKKNVDHRTPMMRDLPNAFNPLTGRRYAYPRNVFNFAGLSHTAQRRRMAAWNTALDQGLVEYD